MTSKQDLDENEKVQKSNLDLFLQNIYAAHFFRQICCCANLSVHYFHLSLFQDYMMQQFKKKMKVKHYLLSHRILLTMKMVKRFCMLKPHHRLLSHRVHRPVTLVKNKPAECCVASFSNSRDSIANRL